MRTTIEFKLSPQDTFNDEVIRQIIADKTNVAIHRIKSYKLLKRSIDARKRNVVYQLRYEVFIDEVLSSSEPSTPFPNIRNSEPIHIIGCGPAGLFAALQAIKNHKKPIIFERGKDVRSRRRDLAAINKDHIVNPESNYCFGEGGAGTYSDGKLYTRSTKRGDVQEVLNLFVEHGASEDILVDAHPHIGTNKLPKIITAIRETIQNSGGEIHFNTKLTNIQLENDEIKAIELNHEKTIPIKKLILATGHSARDIFELLHKKGIEIQAKPFAIGVRVEHPQALIDKIQYNTAERGEFLPPAAYNIVKQVDGKGVYSFCMCPGGIIAPCATEPKEIVTNGWSPSKRNNPFANSGIVISVDEKDWQHHNDKGLLAAMYFQAEIEKRAYDFAQDQITNKSQSAPAQRLLDFVDGKKSKTLPPCSYQPGIVSSRVDLLFPKEISQRLQKAFTLFGASMKGYLTNDAVVVGVESRTSSPVRIPRDKKHMHHLKVRNLYPCAEGAGYAGGIASAAIDGMKCAKAAALAQS